jgi:hypothetical protein
MEAAAVEWGGKVEKWTPLNGKVEQLRLVTEVDTLAAWLPPGDPLSQANEMWNRGGAVRRCDGETESKSKKPCLCLAQFGDEFYRRKPTEVCKPYSHLNILLLQLPDLGQWRHTTKSFYAAGEIAGRVDFIKAQVGMDAIVPVWLIIDQRAKVAEGKTTPYPVPMIRIRGAESAMAMLTGGMPTLELEARERQLALGGSSQRELPGAREKLTAEKVVALAKHATNVEQVQQLWRDAVADEAMTDAVAKVLNDRATSFTLTATKRADEAAVDADSDEPDPDATWALINAAAGKLKWSADRLEKLVIATFNKASCDINGWQMQTFLAGIQSGEIQ